MANRGIRPVRIELTSEERATWERWVRRRSTAQKMMRGTKAGMVWINTRFELDVASPFGGYKQGVSLARSRSKFTQIKSVLMQSL